MRTYVIVRPEPLVDDSSRLVDRRKPLSIEHLAALRTLEPYVSIKGIWDFERSGTTSPHGILASTSDIRARIEGGAGGTWIGGWSIRTSVFYDGIGASDFEVYGGRIRASVPLN